MTQVPPPPEAGAPATRRILRNKLPRAPRLPQAGRRMPDLAPIGDAARATMARAEQKLGPVLRPARAGLGWVSGLGWSVLLLGAVSWWVGVRFGWAELLMVAGAALLLFVLCVVLAAGRTRVTVVAEVDPRRVTVGDPASGRVVVTNTGRTPKLPLLVELPVGVSAARFVLPTLTPGAVHEELFVVPTEHRGVIPVGPATTVQGDPLGLVRRTIRWTEITELFVHPGTVPLESMGAGLLRDLEGSVSEDQSMSDLAFHALREYQPGDDRRYIHWRSSAKAGKLLVRQFLDTRRSHLTVVVDPDPDSYRSGQEAGSRGAARAFDEDVEVAISVGASLVLRTMLDEQEATVVCGPWRASRSTPQLVLDTLARVEVGRTDFFADALAASDLAPDTSVAFFITGPHRPFVEVQRAANHFGPEVRAVAVVIDPQAQPSIRHAGGLVVLSLASLGDLRGILVSGVSR